MTRNTEKPPPDRALDYQPSPRETPIPLWKHILFVPLLFWVGLFIVAMTLVLILALLGILR